MNARFYLPQPLGAGLVVTLSDEEAQHATRVLRLGVGAAIRVFDGQGLEHAAQIVAIDKRGVQVELGPRTRPAAEPRLHVTLVQSVLKGDKMDDVVRDAVMLGVGTIQPVVSERSEISLVALERGARRERWQRVAIASAKQCGRAVLPDIAPPALLWRSLFSQTGALTVMCVEPRLPAGGGAMSSLPQTMPESVRLMVGPEGGWTAEEVGRGAAAASLVTLGDRTIRADAMAMVALTALFTRWREI
jgi:16S rRNA (uracil1498-N3)-methyltransferase